MVMVSKIARRLGREGRDKAVFFQLLHKNLHILPDFQEAIDMARAVAGHGTVVVTGSHHTVGDAMNVLGILPYGPD